MHVTFLKGPMPSVTPESTWEIPNVSPKKQLTDVVAETLVRYIQDRCSGGDQLPSESQLASQLGVSKGPLREALRALEVVGLVEKRNGTRAYVTTRWHELFSKPISWGLLDRDRTLAEVVEARIMVETPMVDLAVDRITNAELAVMEAHVQTMETTKVRDEERFMEADLQFHLVLATGTKNGVLAGFMNIAKSILRRDQLHLLGIHTAEQLQISARVHREIFEGLKQHDRNLTHAAMERHNELLRFYLVERAHASPVKKR
jgi:GntR family transcriptional repressor for pyruvate dehydrogenase complex